MVNNNTVQSTGYPTGKKLDRRRYRRITRFFGVMILDVIWWEVVLKRMIQERGVAQGRPKRLRRYARGFRSLSVDMGGVMIKLGQFISTRVDVMPPEITDELADLQDEVPPEKLDAILTVIEEELGASPDKVFEHFETRVQAAASLGQVYRAHLRSGERVAVKVQRPGIEDMVATDLAALAVVARWAMYWPLISRRADVPALMDEFARTLWEELDYEAEADNADRFRELFADDVGIYVPAVYRDYSSRRVLTLEDVTSIKITDHAAIDTARVNRKVAAQRLLDIYLRMIFDFGFFHADPHPGNLFIYPLPEEASEEMLGREAAQDGHPFYIVFVDFGMAGRVTEQVRRGLREALIAVGTHDTKRLLMAYQMLGVLLPSADLARIEVVEAEVLDYIWGKSVPELARMPRSEMHDFALKYRDLLYEMPFQIPQDFIYLARAVSILSGMCTALDPDFNPWEPIATYAQKLVAQEVGRNAGVWVQEAVSLGQVVIGLPHQLQDVLERARRGEIEVRVTSGRTFEDSFRRVELAVNGVIRALVFASLLLSATWLYTSGSTMPGLILFGVAGLAWLALVVRRRNGQH